MTMSRAKVLLSFLLFLAMGLVISQAYAYTQIQTIHITRTDDDGFITPSGIGIDAPLIHILDPAMDIRAYLHFFDVDINFWESLHNATLRLTSASTLPFDADSSVTVYGWSGYDFQGASGSFIYGPGSILSMPLTTAYVNVNTSQFYGGAVLDINVNEIVREIYSHPHWDGDGLTGEVGDSMGFIILGAEDEIRYFYDYRGDPVRSADLIIGFGSPPYSPPGDATWNQTYRGYDIWEVDWNGPNRTGSGLDLNWAKVNMTELTEIDSGASLTVNNGTWTSISGFQAQQINSLFNDSGGAGISSFFGRFAFNISAITNIELGAWDVGHVIGLGTSTPVGGGGLWAGVNGDLVAVLINLHVADDLYRFRLGDRSGVNRQYSTASQWFDEDDNERLYFEFVAYNSYCQVSLYSDPLFQNRIWTSTRVYTTASGPFRYPSLISSLNDGFPFINTGEYYTFLDFDLAENKTWAVVDENGTVVDDSCITLECAEYLIDEISGGPQPEEPNPPGLGYPTEGPFTRFRMRAYIFGLGFFCVFGPIWFFAWKRPTAYYLFIGALIIITGLGLILHVTTI